VVTPGPTVVDSATDVIPRRRFVLVRTLGEGSFGSVFLADMEGAGGFRRRVALKLLNSTWDPSSDAGRRLRDEARLLGRLQHRHIVRVDDLVRVNGQWALVMEYIPGADLETLFARARASDTMLPMRAVTEMGAAIAAALDAAWSAEGDDGGPLQVIHRDIKPSNVRLSETGEIKVLDFGVARADFAGREARTERVRYGSLGYMAPERLLGEPELPSADVYALAVILYELLTLETFGRSELAPDPHSEQIGRAELTLLERRGPEGALLTGIIARALSYDVNARPTAAEMEMELRAVARVLAGDDLLSFSRANLSLLSSNPTVAPDPVEGTVMEEATGAADLRGMAASSQEVTLSSAAPPPSATPSGSQSAGYFEDPPEPAAPARWAWLVGAVAAVGLLALGGVGMWWSSTRATPTVLSPPMTAGVSEPVAQPAPPPTVAPSAVPPPAEGLPSAVPADPAVALVSAPLPAASAAVVGAPPSAGATTAGKAPSTSTSRTRPADGAAPSAAASPATSPPPAVADTTAAPESSSKGTRLRLAKFNLATSDGVSAVCGDVRGAASKNLILRDIPPGSCTVTVNGHTTTVALASPTGFDCAVQGDALSCRPQP